LVDGPLNYVSLLLANQDLIVFISKQLGRIHHLNPITFMMQKL